MRLIFRAHSDSSSHGIGHAKTVLSHMIQALSVEPSLSSDQKMILMLAALLHDADDRKYFGDEASLKLKHGREIALAACGREVKPDEFFIPCSSFFCFMLRTL